MVELIRALAWPFVALLGLGALVIVLSRLDRLVTDWLSSRFNRVLEAALKATADAGQAAAAAADALALADKANIEAVALRAELDEAKELLERLDNRTKPGPERKPAPMRYQP